MMLFSSPNLPSTIRKKSRLSLKYTLNKVDTIKNNQDFNHVSNAKNTEIEDSLDDFKSPKKVDTNKKTGKINRKRKIVKPYPFRYPGDNECTQDILVSAWKKAKAKDTEYLSENEFEVFQESRQKKKLQYCNKATNTEPMGFGVRRTSSLGVKAFAGTATSLSMGQEKPVIKPSQLDCSLPSKGFPIRNVKSLRKGYQKMKIQNVTIPDSDPSDNEVIESSQKPAPENCEKLQTVCQSKNDVANKMKINSVVLESCETSINKISSIEPKVNEKLLDSMFEIKPSCFSTKREIGVHYKMYCDPMPNKATALDQVMLMQSNTVQNDKLEQENKIVLDIKSSPSMQEDTKAENEDCQNIIEKALDKWNTPTNRIPQLPTIVQASQSGWHVFHSACKNVIQDQHLSPQKIKDSSHRPRKLRYTYVRQLWWINKFIKGKRVLTMTGFKSSRIVKSRSK